MESVPSSSSVFSTDSGKQKHTEMHIPIQNQTVVETFIKKIRKLSVIEDCTSNASSGSQTFQSKL